MKKSESAMNQISLAEVISIVWLAEYGATLREIAKKVGCSKNTVRRYIGRRGEESRSAGLKRHHAKRKAEGRPIFPPWYYKLSKDELRLRDILELFADADGSGHRSGNHLKMPRGQWHQVGRTAAARNAKSSPTGEITLPVTKLCINCHIEKPLGDFYLLRKGGTDRQSRCKPCDNRRRADALRVDLVGKRQAMRWRALGDEDRSR